MDKVLIRNVFIGFELFLTVVAIELNALKGRENIKSDVFSVLRYD